MCIRSPHRLTAFALVVLTLLTPGLARGGEVIVAIQTYSGRAEHRDENNPGGLAPWVLEPGELVRRLEHAMTLAPGSPIYLRTLAGGLSTDVHSAAQVGTMPDDVWRRILPELHEWKVRNPHVELITKIGASGYTPDSFAAAGGTFIGHDPQLEWSIVMLTRIFDRIIIDAGTLWDEDMATLSDKYAKRNVKMYTEAIPWADENPNTAAALVDTPRWARLAYITRREQRFPQLGPFGATNRIAHPGEPQAVIELLGSDWTALSREEKISEIQRMFAAGASVTLDIFDLEAFMMLDTGPSGGIVPIVD
ncbi:MAG: hypothetical protein AAF995_01270 [Planctomycetota bacterium]